MKDPFLREETSEQKAQRERIEKAVGKYTDRELRRLKPKRRNNRPEEEYVEEQMAWYRANGFFMKNYESKARFINGEWRQVGVEPGTPDMGGVCPEGFAHWNEAKAPGRRSMLRPEQRVFLVEVIQRGGFGICSDSVDYMRSVYDFWVKFRKEHGKEAGVRFLLKRLPKSK